MLPNALLLSAFFTQTQILFKNQHQASLTPTKDEYYSPHIQLVSQPFENYMWFI